MRIARYIHFSLANPCGIESYLICKLKTKYVHLPSLTVKGCLILPNGLTLFSNCSAVIKRTNPWILYFLSLINIAHLLRRRTILLWRRARGPFLFQHYKLILDSYVFDNILLLLCWSVTFFNILLRLKFSFTPFVRWFFLGRFPE